MRIDRRLTLLGVMLIVLSMTMATQYATTKMGYTYSIVHPSESDIRFIASDNSSGGGRVLQVAINDSSHKYMTLELGNWTASQNKTYTAAFGIVNEELFGVNITHINVSGTDSSETHMDIWLHSNRSAEASSEPATSRVKAVAGGAAQYTSSNVIWKLAAGDGDKSDMDLDGSSNFDISTPWDPSPGSAIRYCESDQNYSINGTSDAVWVQITIDIPQGASTFSRATGQIWIHFEAYTH